VCTCTPTRYSPTNPIPIHSFQYISLYIPLQILPLLALTVRARVVSITAPSRGISMYSLGCPLLSRSTSHVLRPSSFVLPALLPLWWLCVLASPASSVCVYIRVVRWRGRRWMDGFAAFRVARDAVNMPPGKITSQRRKPTMKMARYYSSICVSLYSICSGLYL